MALITNFATFKQFVRYNFSAEDINSLPNTAPAEREFILPLIGQTLYDDLKAQVLADVITKPDLLELVRAAIAPLTVFQDLPVLQSQLGDTGLRTLFSENTQAAHRWEYNEVKDYLEDKGCKALDQLIQYLFTNKTTLAWTPPATMCNTFKTGSAFNVYYTLKYPERTFFTITDNVKQVEDQYISSSIGEEFFVALIAKDAPSAAEKVAIDLIKKAVANLTVMKVITKKPVKISPHGLFVSIGDAVDDKYPKDKTAGMAQYGYQLQAAERDGESYLQKLKEYLNTNASAEVFTAYFGSDYYEDPAEEETESKNASRTGTFGM